MAELYKVKQKLDIIDSKPLIEVTAVHPGAQNRDGEPAYRIAIDGYEVTLSEQVVARLFKVIAAKPVPEVPEPELPKDLKKKGKK